MKGGVEQFGKCENVMLMTKKKREKERVNYFIVRNVREVRTREV